MPATGEHKRRLNRAAYLKRQNAARAAALAPSPAAEPAIINRHGRVLPGMEHVIAAVSAAPPLADRLPECPPWPSDPAGAVAAWAAERLVIPSGRLRGEPFVLPEWQTNWLRPAFEKRQAALSVARKNGKTGLVAAVILAFLCGPLRRPQWRCIVASLTANLAAELKRQVQEIVDASGLGPLVRILRSPAPGRIIGPSGDVQVVSADKASGHAAGADLVIVDEAGLLPEAKRSLWDALNTATSGRDGKLWAISVRGDGPMFDELLRRSGDPDVHAQVFAAPDDCRLDDRAAWAAANPGLERGIKSLDYMAGRSREALAVPTAAASFRSLDLNQPISPAVELVADREQWMAVECEQLPPRNGRCWVGLDLGGSTSLTAAAALWESGRLDLWAAIPAVPEPIVRGRRDGVGDLYVRAIDAGHLVATGQHVTDVAAFLASVFAAVPDDATIGCDRYRKAELLNVLADMGQQPTLRWRGAGASATADGSHDVRAFQRDVGERALRVLPNPLMRQHLAEAAVRRDPAGNPALNKAAGRSRIDLVSAAVIACGLRSMSRRRPDRPAFRVAR